MRHLLEGVRLSPRFSDKGAFVDFPNGCCEYGSLYLARYMLQEGVCAKEDILLPAKNIANDKGQSHAWLRITNRWHVDITADQFGGGLHKVIISEKSAFHEGFKPMKWESFDEADHYVFELLGKNLTYIGKTWEEMQDILPELP